MRIHDYVDYWAQRIPEEPCVSDGTRSVSWAEMREWTTRIGRWLATHLEPGARFGVLSKNNIEMPAIYYGASRAGVVPVPLNTRLAPPEWDFILTDAEVQLILVEQEFVARIEEVPAGKIEPRFCIDGAPEGWGSFTDEVADTPALPPERDVDPDGVLWQMYTSGTTGKPKGAVLTQRAVTTNIGQLGTVVGITRATYLMVMPLFHAGGALTAFLNAATGCATRVMREFDPAEAVEVLRTERINSTTLVPAMVQALLAQPGTTEGSFPDLRLIAYGSAPIASEVLRDAMRVFGCDFIQGYGMTELSATATALEPADHVLALAENPDLLLSCGRPIPGTEVRVVDEHDNDVPVGKEGEVVVRGPQTMVGYWNRPAATAEALRGGWMHTGDVGRFDENGYLYICDRLKDMIVSGGENVYPREIEEVLFTMDGLSDATVIGVPDERWGEVARAIVVAAPGATVTETDVIAHCRRFLAGYKCPKSVEFVDVLPRNATGKVLKHELRAPYWVGHTRAVH